MSKWKGRIFLDMTSIDPDILEYRALFSSMHSSKPLLYGRIRKCAVVYFYFSVVILAEEEGNVIVASLWPAENIIYNSRSNSQYQDSDLQNRISDSHNNRLA